MGPMTNRDAATFESLQRKPHAWGAALPTLALIAGLYLLLLACPPMHLLHDHGGCGRQDSHSRQGGQE